MVDILKKTFELLVGTEDSSLPKISLPKNKKKLVNVKPTRRQLIQNESDIGANLFGAIPKGHRREFFNLESGIWIWHEEWTDHRNKRRSSTTRYEIHDNGILKAQEGARYNFIEGQELENFMLSIRLYYERVAREIYHRDPESGRPIPQPAV